jgi:serine/threonine-protein kinase RsbW
VSERDASPSVLRLDVPADAANVALARQAVTGLCEAIGADARLTEDVRLAVTEACTNVVVHAYAPETRPRPLRLTARVEGDDLFIHVEDEGRGMGVYTGASGLGLGVPLIAASTREVEVKAGRQGRGTGINMRFAIARGRDG